MNEIDELYQNLLRDVLANGFWYDDPKRSGVRRLQLQRMDISHDLTMGFPAISTKKLAWKSVVSELVWFLKGGMNIKYLNDHNNHIWDKDAYAHYWRLWTQRGHTMSPFKEDEFMRNIGKPSAEIKGYTYGDLGPVYGYLWRNWPNGDGSVFDQILNIIGSMINTPMSTEHIVTAWHPSLKEDQALPPCHKGFQCMMRPLSYAERYDMLERRMKTQGIKSYDVEDFDGAGIPAYGFELIWEQRSVDLFLGLPFNIASYALLAHIIGRMTNSVPLRITGDLRNVHLYENSIEAAREQMKRDVYSHGTVRLLMKDEFHTRCDDPAQTNSYILDMIRPDMFKLHGYNPEGPLKVEMLARD